MMQLMSIQWTRPSFLPADATFLGRARAVVQLLLQHMATLAGNKAHLCPLGRVWMDPAWLKYKKRQKDGYLVGLLVLA